ncbi:hypothetical protein E4U54_007479 [Claviceps lovelessii]|nr:hypothetical protein E4U54_007479 [Claviceps lovelessii]
MKFFIVFSTLLAGLVASSPIVDERSEAKPRACLSTGSPCLPDGSLVRDFLTASPHLSTPYHRFKHPRDVN